MQKYKIKIYLAGISLLMALIMLVTASVAWFTISTAPEISGIQVGIYADRTLLLSSDNTEYVQYLDLSSKFKDLAPLHPVSTVDGLNWFIPTYNSKTGELRDASEFILDDKLEYANIIKVESVPGDYYEDTTPDLIEGEIQDNANKGYYVYADFWMKTEDEGGCNVRLTIPHYAEFDTNSGSDFKTAFDRQKDAEEEVAQGWYGSYVLNSEYILGEDGTVGLVSREAETAMRVGLLLNPDDPPEREDDDDDGDESSGTESSAPESSDPDDDGEDEEDVYADEKNKFFIYEPNADIRSAFNKPLGTYNKSEVDYILGYKFNSESYKDGTYFVTQPLAKQKYTRTVEQKGIDESTGEETVEEVEEDYFGGKVVDITDYDKTKLIVQKHSEWDLESLAQKLNDGGVPNSNDVVYPMGGFLNTETLYEMLTGEDANDVNTTESGIEINNPNRLVDVSGMTTDIAGSSIIVKLEKEKPIRVRLFIWLEGQDVDCWNDIAAGRFIVNLELAGETLSPPADDTEST